MKSLIALIAFVSLPAFAQEAASTTTTAPAAPAATPESGLAQDFDSLGGNRILMDRAKALEPETQTWIVQNRMVSREHRFEIAPEYSGTTSGDTYNQTQNFGLNVHYHITPRWSVGVKYNKSFNHLTPEGEAMIRRATDAFERNPSRSSPIYPEIDYPKQETLALLNWYPIYGKMNMFDKGVAHFDLYLLGGAGTVQLVSGASSALTAGGGVGFWLNPKVSTRLEMRYMGYTAKSQEGDRKLDLSVASVQVGWLL